MNNLQTFAFTVLISVLLALAIAPQLGVCVWQGDPLEGVVPTCP